MQFPPVSLDNCSSVKVHSKKGPKLEEPRWLSLTCGQRADLAEAQPTTHSAHAEVQAKTGQQDSDWRKKGLSYLVLFSGWDPLRKLRRTLARRIPTPTPGNGGSQRHRAARGSPNVARRGERGLSPTSLPVTEHPCLPSRL